MKISSFTLGIVILAIPLVVMAQDDSKFNFIQKGMAYQCPEAHLIADWKIQKVKAGGVNVVLHFDKDIIPPDEDFVGVTFDEMGSQIINYFSQALPQVPFPKEFHFLVTNSLPAGTGGIWCPNINLPGFSYFLTPKNLEDVQGLTRLVAHELTHFYIRQLNLTLPDWFEEGVALLSEYRVRGRPSGTAYNSHMTTPWTSLIGEPTGFLSTEDERYSIYGHDQLLMIYLYKQLNTEILTQVAEEKRGGIAFLDKFVAKYSGGLWKNFKEAFRDFELAKYINESWNLGPTPFDETRFSLSLVKIQPEEVPPPKQTYSWSARRIPLNTAIELNALYEDFWIGNFGLENPPALQVKRTVPPKGVQSKLRIYYGNI